MSARCNEHNEICLSKTEAELIVMRHNQIFTEEAKWQYGFCESTAHWHVRNDTVAAVAAKQSATNEITRHINDLETVNAVIAQELVDYRAHIEDMYKRRESDSAQAIADNNKKIEVLKRLLKND